MRALFAVCLSVYSVQALSWDFKALNKQKLHVDADVRKGAELLVLVDNNCLGPAVHGKAVQTLLGPDLSVQHKNSGDLDVVALPVQAQAPLTKEHLLQISANACVRGVAENPKFYISTTDTRLAEQLNRPVIGQDKAERIFYHPLYGITQPATIAILDTGIQASHPDLASRIWRGAGAIYGHDFFNGDSDPDDDNGHGTHVAGIAGAQRNNGTGVRGIMGEWSRLMSVKTQGKDGGGFLSDLVNGIKWAADQRADVINLSIAGKEDSALLRDAIEYAIAKNVTVVVASGNDGQEISAANLFTPIGYAKDYLGLLGVGALDALTLSRPAFSNYGSPYVELAAPGAAGTAGILSTFYQSRYLALDGTSMAAPQVSGAAALAVAFMRSHNRGLTPPEVENLILQSTLVEAGLNSSFMGGRFLSVERLGKTLLQSTVIDTTGGFDGL